MPGWQYWFSGAALWVAGSFVITVILGIIGIRTMIPTKIVVLLIGIAILFLFVGWWSVAEQARETEAQAKKLDDVGKKLELIRETMLPDTRIEVRNLGTQSNDQIRKMVQDLVAKMRTAENQYETENEKDFYIGLGTSMTPDERWNERLVRDNARRTEYTNKFRSEILPQATALREEMARRLNIPVTGTSSGNSVTALDYGMLAGVHPLREAAASLEAMARKLP